jgi:hypothetical protein
MIRGVAESNTVVNVHVFFINDIDVIITLLFMHSVCEQFARKKYICITVNMILDVLFSSFDTSYPSINCHQH